MTSKNSIKLIEMVEDTYKNYTVEKPNFSMNKIVGETEDSELKDMEKVSQGFVEITDCHEQDL
jgi:hypothetical protein